MLLIISCGLSLLLFSSCFVRANTFYRSSNSKKDYLAVKVFVNSQCGCTDMFAQKYDREKLTYEFYYGCTHSFLPGKSFIKYDNDNNLVNTQNINL
jgi:hypothetical protein